MLLQIIMSYLISLHLIIFRAQMLNTNIAQKGIRMYDKIKCNDSPWLNAYATTLVKVS